MFASATHDTVDGMSFAASAKPLDGSLRHEVDVNGRHTITTDEPEKLGGSDTAPTPHELLAAMIASCASTMMALYARRHGWTLEGMRVDVEYEAEETPRRVAIHLHLPGGLTAEQAERLRRVAETCPARRALEAGFEFEEHLAVAAPERQSAPAR
jgi:putative redox protein